MCKNYPNIKYIVRTVRTEHLYYSRTGDREDDFCFTRREDKAMLFDSKEMAIDALKRYFLNSTTVREIYEIVKIYMY